MKTVTYNPAQWKRFFFTIWSGQAASLFGSRLVDFALVWYMTTQTGSAVVLTTASIVSMLPMILALFFGGLVDRFKRRNLMIFADGLIAVFTLLIALLFWLGSIQIWHLYVLLLVRSTAGVIHFMSMMASTSLMVPEQQLSRVAGMNQTLNGVMNIAAPPLGALLMTVLPIYSILFIDVATALMAILPLVFIRIPEVGMLKQPAREGTNLFGGIREGIQYIYSRKGLLSLLSLSLLSNFMAAPLYTLLPLLATRHFGGGALEFAWMEGASGVGVVVGGLLLSAWGGFKKRIYTMLWGGVLAGVSVLLIGAAPAQAFWMAVAGCFLAGFSISFTDGPFTAVVQAGVAPEVQGRVFSVIISVIKMATPLALVLAGQLAERLGVRFWYFMGGAGMLLLNAVGFMMPALLRLEEEQPAGGENKMPLQEQA